VCLQCPSYGHCPQCEARKTHKEHIMLRVPEPTFAFNYQPGVRCGGCGNAITDIRYRCITCPGFHLCPTCEERKPHSNHPTLRMLARTNPAATEMNQSSAPLVHGRVLCTGCKGPIIGFRYECVSCQEVSLCGKCEEKDNTHLEHPLLRFPTFVAQRCELIRMTERTQSSLMLSGRAERAWKLKTKEHDTNAWRARNSTSALHALRDKITPIIRCFASSSLKYALYVHCGASDLDAVLRYWREMIAFGPTV
ncbi:unnamed protein product, partial [Darwinula stevensoni]